MSYTALYRVWRPKSFSEVIGQEHISKTLRNAILKDRVSHAYLFSGPRGTGKTSMAKIIAKSMNCLNLDQGEPCNECENCVGINQGSFMDYLEIDAASNRGIDEIREMRDKVRFAPSQGKYKVYVIDEVHMLTNEAFNALLKTLEEPPSHVIFILATTEPQKIPLTILSRCQRYDFKKITNEKLRIRLKEILTKEEISIEDDALEMIVRKAEGGMRDAISILDQAISFVEEKSVSSKDVEAVLGILNNAQLMKLYSSLFENDNKKLFMLLDELINEGKDIKQIMKDMIEYLREILLYSITEDEKLLNIGEANKSDIIDLSRQKKQSELNELLNKLIDAEQKSFYFAQPRILLEVVLIGFNKKEDLADVLKEKVKEVFEKENSVYKPVDNVENLLKNPQKGEKTEKTVKSKPRFEPENHELGSEKAILEEIRNEKVTLHACLIAGKFKYSDGNLEVAFSRDKQFHKERVAKEENVRLIEKIYAKHKGCKVDVSIVYEGEEPELNKEPRQEDNDILEDAIKIFGGKIVEMKD